MPPSHSETFNFPIQLPILCSIKSRILAFEDPIPALSYEVCSSVKTQITHLPTKELTSLLFSCSLPELCLLYLTVRNYASGDSSVL